MAPSGPWLPSKGASILHSRIPRGCNASRWTTYFITSDAKSFGPSHAHCVAVMSGNWM